MTLVWNQGRADVEQLLTSGRLTRVTIARRERPGGSLPTRLRLRASGEGAHATIQQAVTAQLGGSDLVRDRFGWLRRERNLNEYPTADAKLADSADAADAITIAGEILTKSAQALDLMPPFVVGA